MMMVGVEQLHRCSCYLEIMPGTTAYGPQLRVIVTAVSREPGSDLRVCEESVSMSWPNNSNTTMDGAAYSALIQLDNRLTSLWWKQEVFSLP